MNRALVLTIFALGFIPATARAQVQPPPAVDVTVADIEAALATAAPDVASDLPIRVVSAGSYNIGIYVVNRPKTIKNNAIIHETQVAEVYHILKGSGTLVTGGTLAGPITREAPGTTVLSSINNVRGTSITGGRSRHVSAGDVVVIPGYVAHWWSSLDSDMTYLVVRPDPAKVLPRK